MDRQVHDRDGAEFGRLIDASSRLRGYAVPPQDFVSLRRYGARKEHDHAKDSQH